MLDPFDSEFLSQELRDAWKRIEELEEENNKGKEHELELTKEVMRLGKIVLEVEEENKELKETNERLLKYVRELEEDLGFHRPNTGYKPQ